MPEEVGFVISSRNFLVSLDGLPSIRVNDMIGGDEGIRGWVTALYPDRVEALILDEGNIVPGQLFRRLDSRLAISVGDFLVGRAINPLGVPIDGKGPLPKNSASIRELDQPASGIGSRQFIIKQFTTGVTLVDTLVPLGKGQRELVVGDGHSGKTAFLIDLIVNQAQTGTICIYASIGKTITSLRYLLDTLRSTKALAHTIIIAASSSDLAPLIFLAPETAFTVAEYFQKKGKDVLLILDDMGNHAKIYREISLLANKPPGRESYPGDIFYQQAHLMERAGNFKKEFGGGSITALPVIEINLNDFTTFIPTNLMAMTDGHLMFNSSLHNQGLRPAVDVSLSVSRVGRQTQNRVQNLLSDRIGQIMALAQSLETISRFSVELPFETQLTLRQRELIMELIKQEPLKSIPLEVQIILLGLVFTSFLADKSVDFIQKYKKTLIQAFLNHPKLLPITKSVTKLKNEQELIKTLESITPYLRQLTPLMIRPEAVAAKRIVS